MGLAMRVQRNEKDAEDAGGEKRTECGNMRERAPVDTRSAASLTDPPSSLVYPTTRPSPPP